MIQNLKKCSKCKQVKSIKYFQRDRSKKDGWYPSCKECNSGYFNKYHNTLEHKKRKRIYDKKRRKEVRPHLKEYYGMTIDIYNKMFIDQKGCCAICGKHQSEFKTRLCVDHDHNTSKIRKLLCNHCNLIVGHVEAAKKKDIFQKVIEYLEIPR